MAEFYDGDTSYRHNRQGIRLAGANASEMDTPTGDEARDAAILAKYNAGMKPGGTITTDKYGREVRQFSGKDGNTLAQAEVNAGLASAMSGEMAHGVNPTSNAARELLGMEPQGVEADAGFQFLAEQARGQRLAFIDKAITSGALGAKIGTPEVADPLQSRGVVDRAWDRGVDNMQGTFYGFAHAVGKIAGVDTLEKFGEDGVAKNIWEALASPATVASYEDVDGLADAGIYALEALVEFAPQMATDLAAALGTGGTATLSKYALAGVGKAVLRNVGGPGAIQGARALAADGLAKSTFGATARGGALASMYMQSVGESQNQMTLEGIDDPGSALAIGAAKAALDYSGLDTILSQAFKGMSRNALNPETVGQVLGNAARSAGIAASAESVTEATQTLMDELNILSHKPEHQIEWNQVIDAMLKGGIAGGGVAGGTNLATGMTQFALRQPKDSDAVTDTEAEPLADIQAQISNMPEGKVRHFTAGNAEQAQGAAAQAGKASRVIAGGHVQVANTQEELDALPAEPTEVQNQQILGYAQSKEQALADPAGTVAVVAKDANGAVIDSQIVGKSVAAQIAEQYAAQFPEATVTESSVEDAVADRMERRRLEQEAAPPVNAPGNTRPALKPSTATGGTAPARKKAPLKEKTPAPNPSVERLEDAGVNEATLATSVAPDRTAIDRALVSRLQDTVPGTDKTLAATLGDTRVRDLEEKAAIKLLQKLGVEVDALPRARGAVTNKDGQQGQNVDAAYRRAAAQRVFEGVREKIAGTGRKLRADLGGVADMLGLTPAMAMRKAYSSDEAYRTAVADAVEAKYGNLRGMAKALSDGAYSPAEVANLLDALGAEQPAGFKFQEAAPGEKPSEAAKKAAVAARLPTKEKRVEAAPEPEAKAEKSAVAPPSRVSETLAKLADSKVLGQFFGPLSLGARRKTSALYGRLFSLKRDAKADLTVSDAITELRALEVDSKETLDSMVEYLDTLIEGLAQSDVAAAFQTINNGEPEDGLTADSELVAAQTSEVDMDRLRALEATKGLIKHIQKQGITLDTVRNGSPVGLKTYVMALSEIMDLGYDGAALDEEGGALTTEGTQKQLSSLTMLAGVLHGLEEAMLTPATLRDDLLAVVGLTDQALVGLSSAAKDGQDVNVETVFDALANEAKRHARAARDLLLGVLPENSEVRIQFLDKTLEALASKNPEVRRSKLAELAQMLRLFDLATLRVNTATRGGIRKPGSDSTSATANAKGIQDRAAVDKSEQQLSDWTFFALLRRARAFFRPPAALRRGDNWKRKPGEPSVFDTHETWVVDFETFYDPDQGYSLSMMSNSDYLNDPRFATHGLAVTAPGQETRYLTTVQEINDFVAALKASEKPVALVAHNARFDADVMAEKFGFTPDVWIDTMEVSRTAHPDGGSHALAAVAARMGKEKKVQSLAATAGKRDLATELSAEEYANFTDYAKEDANLALEFLQANEPSLAFIAEANAALQAVRGVPVQLSPEHYNFGDPTRNGVAASAAATIKLEGRNLIHIRHRRSDGIGGEISLPFDAIALGSISQSGNQAARNAADAARNLLEALSRLAKGPESSDVGVGLVTDQLVVPHDDLVIFLSPKGPVTFGEAMAQKNAASSVEATLLAAERNLEKLTTRREELSARLNEFLADLGTMAAAETDAKRSAAIDVWMDRLSNQRISDEDVEASDAAREYKPGELLAEVQKIGRTLNGRVRPGMRLSLADNYSELLRVYGELGQNGRTAKAARDKGAKGNPRDEQSATRSALATVANDTLARAGSAEKIRALTDRISALTAAMRKLYSSSKMTAKQVSESQKLRAQITNAEQELAMALAAREWAGEGNRVYPSDIPQHEVDALLRGDGFAHMVELNNAHDVDLLTGERAEGQTDGVTPGTLVHKAAAFEEDNTANENFDGLASGQRTDGVEQRNDDAGLAALFSDEQQHTQRVADQLKARGAERQDTRVFDSKIGQPVTAKAPKIKGPAAATSPDARAPGGPRQTVGFENKLGRGYAFLTPFLNRLKQLNVPLDNITLLSREAATALFAQERRNGGNSSFATLLSQAMSEGGSAYFNINGRSYILLAPDAANQNQALEELAHEIGHAVKDRVWADLLETERSALEQEFAASHPNATADEHLLHEWFADQFMRAAISTVAKNAMPTAEEQGKSPVAKAIASLLQAVRNVWDAVKAIGEPGVEFSAFANRLFAGGYNHIGVKSVRDTTLRFASGAAELNQSDLNRGQLAVNRVKQGWKKGVVPSLRSVFSMAITRMEAISPELANMLFQRANADSRGSRAYEQTHIALANRMMATKDRLIAELSTKQGKARAAEVQAALGDAFTGAPKTAAGKKARAGLNALAELAKKEGLRTVQFDQQFPIAVFDREVVERKRAAFVDMLVTDMKISPAQASEIVLGIVEGIGAVEGAIAPGLPVGAHATSRAILKAIPYEKLRDGGWLLQEHEAALQHWVGGVAKRTAWEKTFGDFAAGNVARMAQQVLGEADPTGEKLMAAGLLREDGKLFNPSAKFHAELEKVRAQSGEQAVEQFLDLLDGVMGRTGANMPRSLRTGQDFVMAFVNWTTLAFSGVASIPEIATAFVRAGGKVGIRDLVASIHEGRQLAEALGVVLSDSSQRIVWQATGEQYQAPLAQKMNFWLFKLNMNQRLTNMSRTIAVGVGAQYLLKAAAEGDSGALARLNVDAETVRAWDRAGRKAPSIGQSEASYAINARVADALSQFVSEATVSPSRFQATHWGNNPMFKLVWHLKHFMYAYGDTILAGMWRDAKRRFSTLEGPAFNRALMASAPAILFALAVMPLAAAALELRDWIRRLNGTRIEERSAMRYLGDIFDRAGGLGPLAFAAGAYKAQSEYGVSLFGSLSPTLGKIDMLFHDYGDDNKIDQRELLWKARQLTPIAAQNKGLWPFD